MIFLLQRFSRPYPSPAGWKNILLAGAIGFTFVTLFLFIVQPFGTNIQPEDALPYFWVCVQFGLVTAVCTLICGLVTFVVPKIFEEERWNVGKEILYTMFFIFFIGFGNFLFAHFKMGTPLSLPVLLVWQKMTLVVGFFPIIFGVFIKEISLLKKYSREAAELNVAITQHTPHPPQPSNPPPVVLNGENQNEQIILQHYQLLYLSAADNYVQVFYEESGIQKTRLLRSTLKRLEEQLADLPIFYRCHRTFIVNLEKVVRVSGNAQGYRLHLKTVEVPIPVSRALNEDIRKKFAHLG